MKRLLCKQTRKRNRRGTVTIEMALVAPIFVALLAGIFQASRLLETQNLLSGAAREGARLAAMDRNGMSTNGQTTNQKIASDIQNFLTATGLSGSEADVYIVNPEDHTTTMDLDDPANELELFELRVELPFSFSSGSGGSGSTLNLVSKIVFRNAPATYAQ